MDAKSFGIPCNWKEEFWITVTAWMQNKHGILKVILLIH